MKKVLVTGATGTVGREVIRCLSERQHHLEIIAGIRDAEKESSSLKEFQVQFRKFDFTDPISHSSALKEIEILFLLRPPQISNAKKYFKPLIITAKKEGIRHIIFVSVQGVENSRIIPHHKIENLIIESGIVYTFLRPAYFMQNFISTLKSDILRNRIFLPAGKSKFTLIDVRDIGAVAAAIILNSNKHNNKAYDLTGHEKLNFEEMAEVLSRVTGRKIKYISPTLFNFFLAKRKEKTPPMFILVMIMLHYLPRFQKEPPITDWVTKITGKEPITFEQFIKDYLHQLG